jgi:hypothetical protein
MDQNPGTGPSSSQGSISSYVAGRSAGGAVSSAKTLSFTRDAAWSLLLALEWLLKSWNMSHLRLDREANHRFE